MQRKRPFVPKRSLPNPGAQGDQPYAAACMQYLSILRGAHCQCFDLRADGSRSLFHSSPIASYR
uniref:Uncharacterized protein n=1 Tax=Anopheles minimus TaxID=112268 RepID=A0A182WNQ2_9DIPT